MVLYSPDARCKIINTQLTFRCLDLEFSQWKWTHSKEATFVFGMLSILMNPDFKFLPYAGLSFDVEEDYIYIFARGNSWALTKICHSETSVLFYFLIVFILYV